MERFNKKTSRKREEGEAQQEADTKANNTHTTNART